MICRDLLIASNLSIISVRRVVWMLFHPIFGERNCCIHGKVLNVRFLDGEDPN
jgi:hypothetical protein